MYRPYKLYGTIIVQYMKLLLWQTIVAAGVPTAPVPVPLPLQVPLPAAVAAGGALGALGAGGATGGVGSVPPSSLAAAAAALISSISQMQQQVDVKCGSTHADSANGIANVAAQLFSRLGTIRHFL